MAVISFGSNISSLNAQRRLSESSRTLNRSFDRLSSGLRINRAGDDAASLSVASLLNADARVYQQAIRNVNDGASLLNIADGALSAVQTISIRLAELSEQAANGTQTGAQRQALHAEANSLVNEYNRIINSTSLNGRKLLDGNFGQLAVQSGYGSNGQISFGLGSELERNVGTGSFAAAESYFLGASPGITLGFGDVTGDGVTDVVSYVDGSGINIFVGNGDGSFLEARTQAALSNNSDYQLVDVNNDSRLDLVTSSKSNGRIDIYLGNGDGSFQSSGSFNTSNTNGNKEVQIDDLNNDGKLDFVVTNTKNVGSVITYLGNGDGTFRAAQTLASKYEVELADFNGDGILDSLEGSSSTAPTLRLGVGNGTFGAATTLNLDLTFNFDSLSFIDKHVAAGDFNNDGYADFTIATLSGVMLALGNGNGTFKAATTVAAYAGIRDARDVNQDGYLDLYVSNAGVYETAIVLGNGDGTFRAPYTFENSLSGNTANLNADGVLDVAYLTIDGDLTSNLAEASRSTNIQHLNISTQKSARQTLTIVDGILDRVAAERGKIGAQQSRLSSALNTLQETTENTKTASARILDADVAEEAAQLVRGKILQKSAAAVLGQANALPELALQLLSNANSPPKKGGSG